MKNITRKSLLLASAAAVVIGLGTASKPAAAFDEVNWIWNKDVIETVTKDVSVNIDANPTGMVELEKIQMLIGDVTASSSVTNFTNNPPTTEEPAGGPAPAPTPIALDLKAKYDDNQTDNPITYVELLNGEEIGWELSNAEGNVDNNKEKIYLTFDLTDMEPDPAPAPGPDAILIGERLGVDLPAVHSSATAVANNQDISSSTSVQLHDGQFLVGGISGETNGEFSDLFSTENAGNTHTGAMSGLISGIAGGSVESALVTADSSVSTILNATVDSSATAVANNTSIDLAAFTPDDAFMIADATQFAYADVTATSTVDDVTIEGYSELGAAGLGPVPLDPEGVQMPAVNSVATAVGNNFSVTVSAPEL